jgi:hypothetical protein
MSTPWIPNGALKDGTLLLGPFSNKQADDVGRVVEVDFNGQKHFVRYSGASLTDQQREEIRLWAIDRISKRAH